MWLSYLRAVKYDDLICGFSNPKSMITLAGSRPDGLRYTKEGLHIFYFNGFYAFPPLFSIATIQEEKMDHKLASL